MLPLNLNDAASEHILDLINSEVAESLTLEYKQQLPNDSSDDKREFLYDIAAMANAAGGDMVFGIVDRRGDDNKTTGIADGLAGMKLPNPQAEITRLSNLIRDSIAPRIVGITMQDIASPDGNVLVIRIPKSWNKPHMVTFGGVNKFFGRNTAGKYPMSVDEIGRVFSEQGELTERILKWRTHRAELAATNNGPIPLAGEVTALFHVIPASAFAQRVLYQSWVVPEEDQRSVYVPYAHGSPNYRYNADGFIGLANVGNTSPAHGYTQLFRSGIVEYANCNCYGTTPGGGGSMIYGQHIEQQVIECYQDAITRLRKQGRNEPLYLGISLIGIANKEFFVTFRSSLFSSSQLPIRHDVFISPEVFVDINEPEDKPYSKTLQPLIDTMWQVAGREGTPFKPNGVWEPFKRYD